MSIRTKLLTLVLPLTKLIGKIHSPWTHKKVTAADYVAFKESCMSGYVILSHTGGDLSNWVIPGFWGHAAIVGQNSVVEAVSPAVQAVNPMDFFFKKDYVAVLKPLFADVSQCYLASKEAKRCVGLPYDFMIENSSDAFTCSELVWHAYNHAIGIEIPFTKRKTLGELTVTPQDYWNATQKFELVWTNWKGKRGKD